MQICMLIYVYKYNLCREQPLQSLLQNGSCKLMTVIFLGGVDTGPHYVALAGLKLLTLLFQSPL
jgi:hypothetical protein